MKILILTSTLDEKDGVGRYSLGILNALKERGIDVSVVSNDVLPSPLSFNKVYFCAPWYAWKLRKLAQDSDLIHIFSETYSYIAYWLSKFSGKKYLVTAHGTYGVMSFHLGGFKRYFHQTSFANAEHIICVSSYTMKRLREFGLENLRVITNGINFDKFYQPSDSVLKKGDYILSVGSLKHRKGYHVSIKAFAEVRKYRKDLRYVIVGNQEDEKYFSLLKDLVSKLHLDDSVEFLQSVSHDKLLALYRGALAFVLTPVSEGYYFEGFGLTYLEAGASGVPLLGSFDTGAEDAIKDGETGILVPQGNVVELSKGILKILEEEEFSQQMSANGIEWSREHDWRSVISHYVNVYSQIIK